MGLQGLLKLTLGELLWSDWELIISGLVNGREAIFVFKVCLASDAVALFGIGDKNSSLLELNPGVAGLAAGGSRTFSGVVGSLGSAWDWLLLSKRKGSWELRSKLLYITGTLRSILKTENFQRSKWGKWSCFNKYDRGRVFYDTHIHHMKHSNSFHLSLTSVQLSFPFDVWLESSAFSGS